MPEEYEEHNFVYEQIVKIMESINNDDILSMLNEADLLLKLMPEEFKKEHKLTILEKKIKEIIVNEEMLRDIKLYKRLKTETETSTEYYGKDRGSDERLHYNKEMEERIMKIQEKIRVAISKIIRHKMYEELDTD